MGTVSSTLKMFDMMTVPLQQVTQGLNTTISTMDRMSNAANKDIKINNTLNTTGANAQRAGAALQGLTNTQNKLGNEQDKIANKQDKINNSFNRGSNETNGLIGKVKGLVAAYLGFQAIKSGIEATDNYTNQGSRLALINDGLQTQEQLQNNIYQAAQRSRGAYGETVNTVAKLGLLAKDSFKSNNETIHFAELMNKSFKISGASISESTNAMYQLTQAMASGRLQGDEFRSIMENAPMLAQAIATSAGKSMGELRKMSKDGEITSQVIKNALFNAADDINAKFATMPQTFGTVWTSIKNKAVMEFATIMQTVNGFLNSDVGAKTINAISNSLSFLASMFSSIINGVVTVGTFFNNNWGMIEPIIWGIVAAMIAYNTISLITNGIIAYQALMKGIHASASAMEAGATFAATVAQYGFNAALMACPVTLIILAIIFLIVVFYAAIGAVNHFAGTSISATGIIVGVFATAAAFIGNIIIAVINMIIDDFGIIWNFIAAFAEFFANVFNDPIGSIVRLFSSMASSILGIMEGIASAMDTLFGSNLASAVSGWSSSLQGLTDDLVGEGKIKVERVDSSSMHLDRFNYGDSYKSGYSLGKSAEEKFDISKLLKPNLGLDNLGKSDLGNFGKIDDGLKDSNKKLKNIDDKIDIGNETLEILRDLAEQESIQNFVTLTPTVQVTTGDIKGDADIDTIISKIETYMENELVNSAEGVYA